MDVIIKMIDTSLAVYAIGFLFALGAITAGVAWEFVRNAVVKRQVRKEVERER
ncbi:hypothetical protein [Lonepinella sp. BR2474]|uniref:hypothetical protein n=1 Tax=Lonepinella sp. BR2474 TaxID=3434548 RepID=UPI003F6DED90